MHKFTIHEAQTWVESVVDATRRARWRGGKGYIVREDNLKSAYSQMTEIPNFAIVYAVP